MNAPPPAGMAGARRDAASRLDSMGFGNAGSAPQGAGKQAMGDVNYRAATNPEQSCGDCVHFDEQGSCELVAGNIDPMATCDLFAPEGPGAETQSEPFEGAPTGPPPR